jgi:CelD/BcsL family acetyltransferase involved in cellulose biosynthesis
MSVQTEVRIGAPLSIARRDVSVHLLTALELAPHADAWQRLAGNALVPNVFYEPWMALPAIEALESTEQLRFLLVFDAACKELWGFIPLEIKPHCLHLPIRNLALWQHRYCYLTSPLLDAAHARETLNAFWRWLEHNPLHAHVLDTNWLLADGPFHALWTDFALGRASHMLNDFPRALYQPECPLPSYLAQSLSRKSAKRLEHHERSLAQLGSVDYRMAATAADAETWVEEFLKLESAGWKGREGGRAFAIYEPDAAYFRGVTKEAFRRGRAMLLSLTLDGKPIAMRHTLIAGWGAFAFRTAYDENYAKFSPGTLLEFEVMRLAHEHPAVEWMDSCAAPRHPHWNRFYRERRMVRRSLFSCGSQTGDFVISTLPLMRWAGKLIAPNKTPEYLQISTKKGD